MSRIEYANNDNRAVGSVSTAGYIARFKANCERLRAKLPPEQRNAVSFSMKGDVITGRIGNRIVYNSGYEEATRKGVRARLLAAKIRAQR
jgi:hypothetical protein